MPRASDSKVAHERQVIEKLIQAHQGGVGRVELEAEFAKATKGKILPRTMRRRLAELVDSNRIRAEGAARETRYFPANAEPPSAGQAAGPTAVGIQEGEDAERRGYPDEDYPGLSAEAEEIRGLVRRPANIRPPVGYRPQFLQAYRPGETWYLPAPLRAALLEIGRTPDEARPAGTYARDILSQLLIDLSWGSSRLEGNTYSRLDTKNLIEFGQRASGKSAQDAQMILNHRTAIEMLVEGAEEVGFDRYTFLNLHASLSENLLDDPADEGRLRQRLVAIGGSVYTPPGIPQQIEEWFDLFLAKADAIPDPFEQSFFVMVHLPYLQPFADVNKRTSRLGANIPLIRANLFPLSFMDVPERAYVEGLLGVYELTRIELLRDLFAWAYERSAQKYRVLRDAMGEPDPVRLKYRNELREAVREAVLTGSAPERESLRRWGVDNGVPEAEADGFSERALGLLLALHAGALARYRLRPSEFSKWKSSFER